MYWPDIIILLIIAFFTVKSAVRGIVSEISSIIALIAAFFLASSYYLKLGGLFSGLVADAGIRHLLSFMGIFLLVYFGFILLGVVGKKIMRVSLLGWFDHLSGGLLGFLKGTFVVCVILILMTTFLPGKSQFLQKSKGYQYLKHPTEIILCLVPYTLKESFHQKQKALLGIFQNKGLKKAAEPAKKTIKK